MSRLLYLAIGIMMVCCIAQAVPTTGAATMVSNNNFTMSATGCSGNSWFQWGMASGQTWAHTPNQTPAAGAISYTMRGTPVFGSTAYYYRACDASGCGLQQTVTTLAITTVAVPTFNAQFEDMKQNNFALDNAFYNCMTVYTNVTGWTVFFGLIFAMLFGGMWLRSRSTGTSLQYGMICSALFVSSATGLQLGLPPEFVAVGQALMYISLTGAIMAFTFR